jgi:hypothetical protein
LQSIDADVPCGPNYSHGELYRTDYAKDPFPT